MKILMVLTSHDKLGNTGRKTGFWLEEFAAPYYTFLEAGADVTIASPNALDQTALYNRLEGVSTARQLDESVDDFLKRLPPRTTITSNWIWIT